MFEGARREIDLIAAHVDACLDPQHVGVVRPLRDRRRDVRERVEPFPGVEQHLRARGKQHRIGRLDHQGGIEVAFGRIELQ